MHTVKKKPRRLYPMLSKKKYEHTSTTRTTSCFLLKRKEGLGFKMRLIVSRRETMQGLRP